METEQSNEDIALSSHVGLVSSPSDDADSDKDATRSLSSDSDASTNDGDLEPRTTSPRTNLKPQAFPPSPDDEFFRFDAVRGQNPREIGNNNLRFISTSISDDLSQKEKVEARQFSALMRPTPSTQNQGQVEAQMQAMHRRRAAAQAASQNLDHRRGSRPPPGFTGAPPGFTGAPPGFTGVPPGFTGGSIGGAPPAAAEVPFPGMPPDTSAVSLNRKYQPSLAHIPPTPLRDVGRTSVPPPPRSMVDKAETRTGPQPYFRHGNHTESFGLKAGVKPNYPPGTFMASSHVQQQPRKRPRSGLTIESGHLPEDLLNLDVHELEDLIEDLSQRAEQLGSKRASTSKPFKYETLYRIAQVGKQPSHPHQVFATSGGKSSMDLYFDPPKFTEGQGEVGVLQSQLPVMNFDLYLEQNKDIAFIVYKTYGMPYNILKTQGTRGRDLRPHEVRNVVVDESIQPVSGALVEAVRALLGEQKEYASILRSFEETSELTAPYLFVFHQRNEWEKTRLSLPDSSYQQLTMMWDYIVQSQGAEYAAADSEISIGEITQGLIKYLFKPGQLLVQNKDGEIQGWICAGWPRAIRREDPAPKRQAKKATTAKPENRISPIEDNLKWELIAWHWEFDGGFRRKMATLPLSIKPGPNTGRGHGIPINTLDIFPLKYAADTTFNQLRHRGRIFWKCRKRALVSYRGDEDTNDSNLAEERYMIDLKTYQILHKSDTSHNMLGAIGDILSRNAMENDDPPDEDFVFLLPPKMKGFNLRTKKWFDLVADRISNVKWNKNAFSKVVIDRKAKDLIRALVSNQLESEKNTDLIEGKGNGLILLLHGGPGTGKTLTAESVAEIAEKPLYRVTCGDVGTKAEDVEKYLESVLYLGKLWGCVVLLDEADIFLQQRNLEDLQRNALVSVFLRVLEYYEGILVLTSNRVGTFDEAFKSRIQLALHYPALGPYQRLRIWENFFDRLDGMEGELIDLADLRDHLSDLKEEEMNGRQIRNAITTARQYAKWQNTTLTYQHLKDVIEVSGRFDKYLTKLHGGLTEGQLAEDEGLRLGGED